ncbi:glycerol-3-phosphate 1-O-acyltransferase [Rhodococcus sp. 14-2470-1a]|uniref:glycerol-3-phosphate 1-O-acyltransferase n=1 Tax=Rhodococcus sp. 14-2470-1a TaxID=2023150 RepID=UPI000B9C04FF|nr:glycerol-3-phosphate 1-O-acyltransferase [Rhodococcus sp. 14-2470-1a]OZF50673.1 glycerol-3-phosphate acyltransferase [Rhodococcus sp. 14-2470-1a]
MYHVEASDQRTTEGRQVYLLDAAGALEIQALNSWIDATTPDGETRPPSIALSGDSSGQVAELVRGIGDDPLLIPLRVTLSAKKRPGFLRRALAPRGNSLPTKTWQRWVQGDDPDRSAVLVGEPATLGDLSAKFEKSGGRSLSSFIARQATLALDRAERDVIGSEYKIPRFVVEDMTEQKKFHDGIAELARQVGEDVPEVERRVHTILGEMVATETRRAVEMWGTLGAYFSRAYKVDVDRAQLQKVRELNKKHPLVFLPNHRSYLDPLVLRPALLAEGLPLNHVMGGINVGFWPIGPIAKRSGVVLIQRKFSDEIYKWTLRQYMSFLLSKRFNLEWYIEGGRSRTGKLRPPRFGLLTYLVDALESSDAEDVYLVPTAITYDRLHEVGAMAAESHGAQKQAEGIRMAIGYIRAQGKLRGNVYLNFAEPVSVRSILDDNEDKRVAVQKIALTVSHAINDTTPVTPAALVTMALLGIEDRALNVHEMWAIISPLASYIKRRGLPTAGGIDISEVDVVRSAVIAQVNAGVVKRFDDGPEPVFYLAQDKHLVAAFFRNNAIHYFVMRAIGELVVLPDLGQGTPSTPESLWKSALELRDLLKFEFFFGDKKDFGDRLEAEVALIDPDWRANLDDPEYSSRQLESQDLHLAHRVLQPILEAYQVVADQLMLQPTGVEFDKASFVTHCLGAAQARRLRQQLDHSEAISGELFDTALQLADNRNLVDPGGENLAQRRRDFAREINEWARKARIVRDMAHRMLDEVDPLTLPAPVASTDEREDDA